MIFVIFSIAVVGFIGTFITFELTRRPCSCNLCRTAREMSDAKNSMRKLYRFSSFDR